jgi:leucyl/phenylalanyl-tRNA---protein transferase
VDAGVDYGRVGYPGAGRVGLAASGVSGACRGRLGTWWVPIRASVSAWLAPSASPADTLLRTLAELHAGGWAHSVEVWLDGILIGGAIGIGIGRIISGDSLFGRHQGAARVAVADMAARLDLAGGLLIDAQWDSPFLRSLGAVPVPRERYLPLLDRPAERIELPPGPLPARRLLGPAQAVAGRPA